MLLAGSHLAGQELDGVVAAGAALSVGFGASRELHGRRWRAMLAATLGISLAAGIGSLVGLVPWLLMLCMGAAAAACAALDLLDDDLWWVSLQVAIALP